MQNRYQGKGAEQKSCCALFLLESKKEQKPYFWQNKEVTPLERQVLRKTFSTGLSDIVAVGFPGGQTAALLLEKKKEELSALFPAWVLGEVSFDGGYEGLCQNADLARDAIGEILLKDQKRFRIADGLPALLFEAADHGIFGALWDMGEALGSGIEAELLQIPMKQSVIEILGHFQLNPYELPSKGVFLLVLRDGRTAARKLQAAGLFANVIGQITPGPDRVLMLSDEIRHLNIPRKSDWKDLKALLKMKNSENDFSF